MASVSSSHSAIEELSFNDFMLKYSKNLPLKVRVSKGFLGVSEETAINTGVRVHMRVRVCVCVCVCVCDVSEVVLHYRSACWGAVSLWLTTSGSLQMIS